MSKYLSIDQSDDLQVIIPVSIVMAIHRDERLSSTASILWQFIFIGAYTSTDWTTLITIEQLANSIDRSPKTVRRILKELISAGYLLHNAQASRFTILLPSEFPERDAIEEHRREVASCQK